MSVLSRLNAQYGRNEFIPVEKQAYKPTTKTSAIISICNRIDETVDTLASIESLRSARAAECKTTMSKKKRGNIVVKVGYGSNNQQIHSELGERICPTLEEAIAYLKTVKGYFEKGILDEIVENHLNKLRERSANARKKKQEYKDAVQIRPGEPVDVLTEIRLHKPDIAA